MIDNELIKDLREIVRNYMQDNEVKRNDGDYAHDIMREELQEALEIAMESEINNI